MLNYVVKQGDCLSSIGDKYGIFWEKIWNHPKNSRLKAKQQDPNILYPGDVVFVPEKEEKEESCAPEQKHKFRRKGTPAKLRLRLMEEVARQSQERITSPQQAHNSKDSITEDPEVEEHTPEKRLRRKLPYILEIDGSIMEGHTDDEGTIEHNIKPDAKQGRLILEPGTLRELVIHLQLGI